MAASDDFPVTEGALGTRRSGWELRLTGRTDASDRAPAGEPDHGGSGGCVGQPLVNADRPSELFG